MGSAFISNRSPQAHLIRIAAQVHTHAQMGSAWDTVQTVLNSTQHWLQWRQQSSFSADKGIWDVLFFASLLLSHKDIRTRRWHSDFYGYIIKHSTIVFLGWSLSLYPSSWDSPHRGRLQASISVRHYEPSAFGSFCSIAANITAQ